MTIAEDPSDIPPQEMAAMEEVCRLISEGKRVTDPALLGRIYERPETAPRQIWEKYGVAEWAVDLIREARDEECITSSFLPLFSGCVLRPSSYNGGE